MTFFLIGLIVGGGAVGFVLSIVLSFKNSEIERLLRDRSDLRKKLGLEK